ncbi:MAG: HDOD domain-containing protein [Pseudomonadota bacterium]
MARSLEEWVAYLSAQDLPVLRRTITELEWLGSRPDELAASRLAASVLHDPFMTLNILRLANASRHGRLDAEITTVAHAAMMLGITPLFELFSTLAALEDTMRDRQDELENLLRVFTRSIHAAYQAREWAIQHQDIKVEEVYIAALLHDLPEMMLWRFAPDTAREIRDLMRREHMAYKAAHKEVMGFEVPELRLALARAWQFPEQLLEMEDCSQAGKTRVQGVLLAVAIARLAEDGWYGDELQVYVESMADQLHLPRDDVERGIHQAAVAAARQWEWYGVRPAAALLPMLPGKGSGDGGYEKACLAPHQDRLRQITDEIAAHLDGTLNLHDLMLLVLRGMREGLGLSRVLFALLTPDHGRVRTKYILGAEPGSPLRHFEFDLGAPHLFSRLMEKMQGVWFNEANSKTLGPLIRPELRRVIGEGDFFAMSVFVHDKPVGLFYADRKHGGCALDEHAYEEFKKLCLRGAQGLAHVTKK